MSEAATSTERRRRDRMRRPTSLGWLKVLIAASVIGLLTYFNRIDVQVLASATRNWPWLVGAFLLMLPPCGIVSYRFKVVLAALGIEVSFWQALRWTMIGSFFDLAMPSSNGGDIVKAGYVVSHVGAGRRTRAVMGVGFDRVIGMLGLFLLASVVGILGWDLLRDLPSRNLVVAASLTAGLGSLIAFRVAGARRLYHHPRMNSWLSRHTWGLRLRQLIGSFTALRERPRDLFVALGLSMLNHVFWCASLLLIAVAVGNAVPPIKGFVVFPLAIFGNVFGVAGGFGIGTVGFDLVLSNLLSIQNGALIGLVFQVLNALWRVAGLPFYLVSGRYPNARVAAK